MKKYLGLWLDHREAFLVYLLNNQPLTGGDQETIETADKMTIRQIAAKTRGFFKPHI